MMVKLSRPGGAVGQEPQDDVVERADGLVVALLGRLEQDRALLRVSQAERQRRTGPGRATPGACP